MVAAGAVVAKDVDSGVIVGGVPARGIVLSLKALRCLSVVSLYDCISGEAETWKLEDS